MKPFQLAIVLAFIAFHAFHAPTFAADTATPATTQIEALINEIQTLKDASFVRNGSTYDAKTAAKFLRGKWDSHKGEINSAADFIERAASVSSTTGKPYLIRFNDGREIKCGDFLNEKLEKLKAVSPKQP